MAPRLIKTLVPILLSTTNEPAIVQRIKRFNSMWTTWYSLVFVLWEPPKRFWTWFVFFPRGSPEAERQFDFSVEYSAAINASRYTRLAHFDVLISSVDWLNKTTIIKSLIQNCSKIKSMPSEGCLIAVLCLDDMHVFLAIEASVFSHAGGWSDVGDKSTLCTCNWRRQTLDDVRHNPFSKTLISND